MKFIQTPLIGAYVMELDTHEDDRGFFARIYDSEISKQHNLNPRIVQSSISYNRKKGTLRGMHFQVKPYEEVRTIRCTAGAIHDVIIDLRPDSVTYKKYFAIELTSDNRKTIYVPQGFAHGFLTLSDRTEVYYQMSEFYHPESVRTVRWNDPVFAIDWPMPIEIISEKDKHAPDFTE